MNTNGFNQNMHVYFIIIIIQKQTNSQLNNTLTYKKILQMKRLKTQHDCWRDWPHYSSADAALILSVLHQ